MNLLPKITPRNNAERRAELERSLMRREAEIGGQLFGPVPEGRRRQFFCLDSHTWIWHEEWKDQNGQRQSITTRYDVRPNGILKVQDGRIYQRLSRQESENLCRTATLYRQRIGAEYQRMLQAA